MNDSIKNILQNTYERIAKISIESGISNELILNQIKLSQNEIWRNAYENTLSQKINEPEKYYTTELKIEKTWQDLEKSHGKLREHIERMKKVLQDTEEDEIENNIIENEIEDEINFYEDEIEIPSQKIEKIFTSRWPETSRVAIKSKLKMEELLRESENNIFNPELPNTKEEICSACEIKLCNLGDFKNWLKTYRYDFYIKFIEDFPGFGGRK